MLPLRQHRPLHQGLPAQSTKTQANCSSRQGQDKVQVKQGRLNFTTLEDLPEGAPVMTSTFFVLNQPTIILFDFGALHSFISQRFSVKCHLPFFHTKGTYMIAMPGARLQPTS
jgi:hypothetical protein